MGEVWRVVLRDGSVREVMVTTEHSEGCPPEYTCEGECSIRSAHDAVMLWVDQQLWTYRKGCDVREILAPGEPTRAEAVAFERGRDAVDEAGARAMRAAALRDAVAAERERCARWCDEVAAERRERLRALESEGISPHDPARLALVVAITDAERCAAKIRAGGV